MKGSQFFFRLIVVAGILIVIDRGLGGLLQHYYARIKQGELGRTNYAVDSCMSETVILGSSRAEHHYVSPLISEQLQTTCYNAGHDKQRLRYALALMKIFYKRYAPHVIILDLNPTAFEESENGLDELSVLLPYYGPHPEIRSIIHERNRFEWIKAKSSLYCFNSLPLKILFNNLATGKNNGVSAGYVPLTAQKDVIPVKPELMAAGTEPDSSLVNCFKSIIDLARSHQTQLIVVVSPIYYRLPPGLVTIQIARKLCESSGIRFLDYSQADPFLARGTENWLDRGHLNDSCSRLFTRLLCREIQSGR